MNEVRPEGTGHWGKSEAAREAGSIDQNTPSDRRMIVLSDKILNSVEHANSWQRLCAWTGCMVGNHDAHHKPKHFENGLEICSRYHVHSAWAADLAAVDDFAHAGDANRLARPNLLPPKARRSWRKAFFHLEVQNDAGEC